ncbi:ferrichrome ABC transporter (permease) [Bacillus inaquosorum KCTC 13429]|uniref:Ferrichrome ABC transporter (Permease) n=1 Tax=Bacillus inaquosorum KCTC 13429 TaxID=1236548 RepID=A0A9W5PBN8_9BACI|nr:ferrichrome ABC transporter (permease) [Bacillus inaquosorum KCTC 13429]
MIKRIIINVIIPSQVPVGTIFLQIYSHFYLKRSIKSAEKSDILEQQLIIIIIDERKYGC